MQGALLGRQRTTLEDYVESLADTHGAICFRVEVGTRTKRTTEGVIALRSHDDAGRKLGREADVAVTWVDDITDFPDEVATVAADAGWPEEHPTCRLHPYDEEGRRLRTWQKTDAGGSTSSSSVPQADPANPALVTAEALQAMAHEMVRAMAEQRRTMGVLTDTIAHREDALATALEDVVSANRRVVDAEAGAIEATYQALMDSEEDLGLTEQGVRLLEGLAERLPMLGGGGPISKDQLMGAMKSNPEQVKKLFADKEVRAAVAGALSGKSRTTFDPAGTKS